MSENDFSFDSSNFQISQFHSSPENSPQKPQSKKAPSEKAPSEKRVENESPFFDAFPQQEETRKLSSIADLPESLNIEFSDQKDSLLNELKTQETLIQAYQKENINLYNSLKQLQNTFHNHKKTSEETIKQLQFQLQNTPKKASQNERDLIIQLESKLELSELEAMENTNKFKNQILALENDLIACKNTIKTSIRLDDFEELKNSWAAEKAELQVLIKKLESEISVLEFDKSVKPFADSPDLKQIKRDKIFKLNSKLRIPQIATSSKEISSQINHSVIPSEAYIDQLKSIIIKLKSDYEKIQEESNNNNLKYEQLINEKSVQLSKNLARCTELENLVDAQASLLETQKTEFQDYKSKSLLEIQNLNLELKNASTDNLAKTSIIAKIELELEKSNTKIELLRTENIKLSTELSCESKFHEKLQNLARSSQDIEYLKSVPDNLLQKIDELTSQTAKYKATISTLNSKLNEYEYLNHSIQEYSRTIDTLHNLNEELHKENQNLRIGIVDAKKKWAKPRKHYNFLNNQFLLLQQKYDDREKEIAKILKGLSTSDQINDFRVSVIEKRCEEMLREKESQIQFFRTEIDDLVAAIEDLKFVHEND